MKLQQVAIQGTYKGLKDQAFDFFQADGNVTALIGLNGSGKSQLLELICESFAWLERAQRDDFRIRKTLPFGVSLQYQIQDYRWIYDQKVFRISIDNNGYVSCELLNSAGEWLTCTLKDVILPAHIVGYASGLNENLQRSFMKNAVQFFDVMAVRSARRKRLKFAGKRNERAIAQTNLYYLSRYSGVFSAPDSGEMIEEGYLSLKERDTVLPMTIFLDYDCNALLLACMAILSQDELDVLFPEIPFRQPRLIELQYDLRQMAFEEDAIKDIQQLIYVAGNNAVCGISKRTTVALFELFELDYLAATITLDLSQIDVRARLIEFYDGTPLRLFRKLYKIQLLGVKNWQGRDKINLRNDSFMGTVKKPLKANLPLAVTSLKLSDQQGRIIDFDDLSDGEAQLFHVLAAARIFRDENTLFIFDEPETHLNPSWRTHFHQHLNRALNKSDQRNQTVQMLLSTHSPFLISSLHHQDVLRFERLENGDVTMESVSNQTYGASFEVLIKQFFGLKSLISQTAVDDIKRHLELDDAAARQWLEENLGDSMEKAYLLRKLKV